jgi:hypothetical protein
VHYLHPCLYPPLSVDVDADDLVSDEEVVSEEPPETGSPVAATSYVKREVLVRRVSRRRNAPEVYGAPDITRALEVREERVEEGCVGVWGGGALPVRPHAPPCRHASLCPRLRAHTHTCAVVADAAITPTCLGVCGGPALCCVCCCPLQTLKALTSDLHTDLVAMPDEDLLTFKRMVRCHALGCALSCIVVRFVLCCVRCRVSWQSSCAVVVVTCFGSVCSVCCQAHCRGD